MKKTERLGLVLTPAEKMVVTQLADGESMAAFIRRLIRQAAKAAGMWPPAPVSDNTRKGGGNER